MKNIHSFWLSTAVVLFPILLNAQNPRANQPLWQRTAVSGIPTSDVGEMHKLYAVNNSVCWALMWQGDYSSNLFWDVDFSKSSHVVRTTDGGASWQRVNFPTSRTEFAWFISALSAKEAWVITGDYSETATGSHIYRTKDGGETWTDITPTTVKPTSFLDVVYFWNPNKGVLIGDDPGTGCFETYTTTDGGETWSAVPCSDYAGDAAVEQRIMGYFDIFTTQQGDVYFTSGDNPPSNKGGYFYKSSDYGRTWQVTNTGMGAADYVSFRNRQVGVACAGDFQVYPFKTKITRTRDGGATWTDITPTNNNFAIYDLDYIPNTSTLLATVRAQNDFGPFRTLMSLDDGTTWRVLDIGTAVASMDFKGMNSGYGCLAQNNLGVRPTMLRFNFKVLQYAIAHAVHEVPESQNIGQLLQPKEAQLNVYPTRFTNEVTVELFAEGHAQIEVMDMTGRTLIQQQQRDNQGWSRINLPTATLQAGAYILRVRLDEKVLQQKIVKQ